MEKILKVRKKIEKESKIKLEKVRKSSGVRKGKIGRVRKKLINVG